MAYVVVEYTFEPPLTEAALGEAFNALKPCLETRNIRRLRSFVSEDGRRGLCEFEAPDTQSLRDAYRTAQVKFERVWTGRLFEFNTPSA